MAPLPATVALDAYFLEARSKLLDVAAIFDRIDRGTGANDSATDPRVARLRRAVEALLESGARAEMIQEIFSLPYDPLWTRPDRRD